MSRSHIYEYGTVDVVSVCKEYDTSGEMLSFILGSQSSKRGTVIAMAYHEPSGEGDTHYVDIEFDSGVIIRVFKPDDVTFKRG